MQRDGFNGSTVREPWLCPHVRARAVLKHDDASMGPRSENRGYAVDFDLPEASRSQASMGPRSENRGYAGIPVEWMVWLNDPASMGPRSENRGYAAATCSGDG